MQIAFQRPEPRNTTGGSRSVATAPIRGALKLTYTPKTGVFKGSFKIYATNEASVAAGKKPALKKYTVNVTGFIVDGAGIGQATLKKPAASWSVTLEFE